MCISNRCFKTKYETRNSIIAKKDNMVAVLMTENPIPKP